MEKILNLISRILLCGLLMTLWYETFVVPYENSSGFPKWVIIIGTGLLFLWIMINTKITFNIKRYK